MSASKPEPPFPAQPLTPPGSEADMRPRPRYAAPEYRAAGKLEGQVALVTGGDSGIGRAVAVLFAREGADVAIVHLPEESEDAAETLTAIEAEGRKSMSLPGDLRDPEFCAAAVNATAVHLGRLDILVNNAAFQRHRADLEEISVEQWKTTFATNIHAFYYLTRAALRYLSPGSAIINTGSVTGLEGSPELLDYSATKGAIHSFTKSLALNLVEQGIRVNCVAPGPVWTPLNPAERDDEDIRSFGADTPMGRPAQPEEIAPAFVFLASSADSGFMSGHVLPLLGGDTTA